MKVQVQTSIFGGGIFPVKYPGKWKPESIAKVVLKKNPKAKKAFFIYVESGSPVNAYELDVHSLEIIKKK